MVKPKIICSTATIKNSSAQILGLFGRANVTLFPPAGIDISILFLQRRQKQRW